MRILFVTLLLSLGFALAPTGVTRACSEHTPAQTGQGATEKSCCSKMADNAGTACCEKNDGCAEQHPGQKCPDTDGCGSCHCPGCGAAGFAPTVFTPADESIPFLMLFDAGARRLAFYFAEHLPESVTPPVWQPPKMDA